jgi:hypothetical protein
MGKLDIDNKTHVMTSKYTEENAIRTKTGDVNLKIFLFQSRVGKKWISKNAFVLM